MLQSNIRNYTYKSKKQIVALFQIKSDYILIYLVTFSTLTAIIYNLDSYFCINMYVGCLST